MHPPGPFPSAQSERRALRAGALDGTRFQRFDGNVQGAGNRRDAYGTRAQTALRYVLSNPDLACAIIGLAEPAHLEEALAGEALGPLPQAALDQLDKLYATDFV